MTRKELTLILEEGEGYLIEFKESMSSLDREMVAFANSAGGRILLGIADNGNIKGVEITNRFKSQIQDIAGKCQPPVKILFEEIDSILVVNVREGTDKPYRCSSGFYTRVGPNSQKLSRDEIIEFFKEEGKIRFGQLVNRRFDFETHFDPKKLSHFLRLARISEVLDAPSTLVNLGVAEKQDGQVIMNNTGILFFTKDLETIYFHTRVTCALFKGTKKVDVLDRRDFNEDAVSSIDRAINFLKQYIPVRYEMTGEPQRREIPEIPYEALREAIINAVAHRDYFEQGANIMVEMFDDRIEITNPGGLPRGLKPEDFGKKSVLRNPNIANLLQRIGYIEKMGTGISKMKGLMDEAGLAPIQFEFGDFFTAIFRRPEIGEVPVSTEVFTEDFGRNFGRKFGVRGRKLARLLTILQLLYENRPVDPAQLAGELKVTTRTVETDIQFLRQNDLMEFTGPKKTGVYSLTERAKNMIRGTR